MTDATLDTEKIDRLVTLVEEATRATTQAPKRFIEPARGTLDRGKARRHHLVFGRRGSGKTSLLRKAAADLSLDRIPTAFVDLEAFKGHAYPDVLLSILIETFVAFESWLATAGTHPATKVKWWQRIFGEKPRKPPLNKARVAELRTRLKEEASALKELLYSADDAQLEEETARTNSATTEDSDAIKVKAGPIGYDGSSSDATQRTSATRVKETRRRNKVDFLHRRIIEYQKLITDLVDLSEGDIYVFLDDLYHIRRSDQAYVLDYFHRIMKGRCAWLKVGTIRHRTDWYRHGDPPIGVKIGDDCDDIDLDITLEKYQLAKEFLLRILDQLVVEAGLDSHAGFMSSGAVERLVLASGGVARDFLTIFRRSVDVARERGVNYRGSKVNAEDVNVAAGEHDPAKRDELKRDTFEERNQLERMLSAIQEFCITRKRNCFLVERDRETRGGRLIGELVDLRFLHVVAARVTARDVKGKLYMAYMLDISQYTGERRRRELEMIRFWIREELDKLRRGSNVFEPDEVVEEQRLAPSAGQQGAAG